MSARAEKLQSSQRQNLVRMEPTEENRDWSNGCWRPRPDQTRNQATGGRMDHAGKDPQAPETKTTDGDLAVRKRLGIKIGAKSDLGEKA
jgi:hypothetical protein